MVLFIYSKCLWLVSQLWVCLSASCWHKRVNLCVLGVEPCFYNAASPLLHIKQLFSSLESVDSYACTTCTVKPTGLHRQKKSFCYKHTDVIKCCHVCATALFQYYLSCSPFIFKTPHGSNPHYKPNFKERWRYSNKTKKDEAFLLSLETLKCQVSAWSHFSIRWKTEEQKKSVNCKRRAAGSFQAACQSLRWSFVWRGWIPWYQKPLDTVLRCSITHQSSPGGTKICLCPSQV